MVLDTRGTLQFGYLTVASILTATIIVYSSAVTGEVGRNRAENQGCLGLREADSATAQAFFGIVLCFGCHSELELFFFFFRNYEAALEAEIVLNDDIVRLNGNGEPGDLQRGFLHPGEIAIPTQESLCLVRKG